MVKVRKIPEGPRDPKLSATFRVGGKGGSKSKGKRKHVRKLGGTITDQGYKDRKDESVAMRIKKKRTPNQLTASRDESYGKFGHGTGKGKINKAKAGGVVKIKSPKVKKPAWMKGLSEDEIKSILGGPHPSGERRGKIKKKPSKVRKAKAGGVVKKAGGGMTRQGLYPAEEARSGTMSEAKRKRYMKKGGKVSYRNMGGVIGGTMPSKDVIKYLYQIKTDKIDY